MIFLLILLIVGAIASLNRKSNPFYGKQEGLSRIVGGAFVGFLLWLFILNPVLSIVSKNIKFTKTSQIDSIQAITVDTDFDTFKISLKDSSLLMNSSSPALFIVNDSLIFEGDTIINISKLVKVTSKSSNKLLYIDMNIVPDYEIHLTESDYSKLNPMYRNEFSHMFIRR
ncbi:gp210 [Sphingomonas phage PAU]|uniref:gp210 n=1 Tax=Sphingomonas phage PAU TaxID=1150991 RepID=UPI0002573370|nr:gp210 [Sphingomonas phage PAU]AFF28208.1 gp210 [Sphingomonas phage PAU]